jgi:phosphoribosylformylglycinamidine (FGAM) synthase PurS component
MKHSTSDEDIRSGVRDPQANTLSDVLTYEDLKKICKVIQTSHEE